MEKAVAKESMIHETEQEVLCGLNYRDYNSYATDETAVNHDCKKKTNQLSVNCQALSEELKCWHFTILQTTDMLNLHVS